MRESTGGRGDGPLAADHLIAVEPRGELQHGQYFDDIVSRGEAQTDRFERWLNHLGDEKRDVST